MPKELNELVKQFADLQHGDCWIGVNFKEALHGLTAKSAAHQPDEKSNSIWALINHIIYWRTTVVNRLTGSSNPPPFADFLLPEDFTEESWKQTLHDFENAYHSLRSTLMHFNSEFLFYPSPREGQSFYDVIIGCLQHDAYHLGQLVLLKKMYVE